MKNLTDEKEKLKFISNYISYYEAKDAFAWCNCLTPKQLSASRLLSFSRHLETSLKTVNEVFSIKLMQKGGF